MARERLDKLLVDRGLVASRERARSMIMRGDVLVRGQPETKPGTMLDPATEITVRAEDHPYVSRGALKLVKGLDAFAIDPAGKVALDIGASTGGFTDVLLTRGAAKAYAVDVGTNQLAWKLRSDPRVVVHEQTNARDLTAEIIPEAVDIVVCDASFIGLAKVLDRALDLARPGAKLIALVKPQFEAGREEVGKGGVVRDPAVHERVCNEAADWVGTKGWRVVGVEPSPITGPEGNVEFLLGAVKEG